MQKGAQVYSTLWCFAKDPSGAGPHTPYNVRMAPETPLDRLLAAADGALRAVFAPARAARPLPQPPAGEPPVLSDAARREAGALMRVNHAGEMAAQALYHGQALVARNPETRAFLARAAREEADHLAWCALRLQELHARPSLLDPLWYAGSFAIGALAAACGDRTSLGFVVETERQVEGHLSGHLDRLPPEDARSRVVLEAMRSDEVSHGEHALRAGAAALPEPVRALMRRTARLMTATAYWI
jgi:3-demethoxyubiquinol 3-hydroxylase